MCSVRAHSLVQCADRGCPGRNAVFFTCPPPLGVLGVPLEALCDVDESFAFLADCDRQHGYAFVGHEATILSNYVKGTEVDHYAGRGVHRSCELLDSPWKYHGRGAKCLSVLSSARLCAAECLLFGLVSPVDLARLIVAQVYAEFLGDTTFFPS